MGARDSTTGSLAHAGYTRLSRPMDVLTTVPVPELATAGELFAELEEAGFDGACTYETRHDPFLPLVLAADRTSTLQLGTAIAIAFARTPMLLATVARDLQDVSAGRFTLGLGTQVRPHIERRYSMPWSRPAARLRELVTAIRAIWDAWDGTAPLDFRGEFYTHTLMPPAFDPGPAAFGHPRIRLGAVGPHLTRVAAEVADGILVHPFATRASLTELTLPTIADGPGRGRPGPVGARGDGGGDDRHRRHGGRARRGRRHGAGAAGLLRVHPRLRPGARVQRVGGPPPAPQRAVQGGAVGRHGRPRHRRDGRVHRRGGPPGRDRTADPGQGGGHRRLGQPRVHPPARPAALRRHLPGPQGRA